VDSNSSSGNRERIERTNLKVVALSPAARSWAEAVLSYRAALPEAALMERGRLGVVIGEIPVVCLSALFAIANLFAGIGLPAQGGLRPIESIIAGDLVWAMDPNTGEEDWREVLETFVHPDAVLELAIEDGSSTEVLTVTGGHPFWERERGWTPAGELLPGDEVFTSRGGWARIGGGTWIAGEQLVYNFEVEGAHTYFVGEAGAWVHNACSIADALAQRISGGHAFDKHVLSRAEFPGVRTRGDLAGVVRDTIENGTHARALANGRYAWFNGRTGNLVVYNPSARDMGTVFPPTNGLHYYNGLR